jgi:hypothetical protein
MRDVTVQITRVWILVMMRTSPTRPPLDLAMPHLNIQYTTGMGGLRNTVAASGLRLICTNIRLHRQ